MCLLPTATCRHPRPPRSGATQRVQFVQPDHLGSPRVVIDAASNTPVWTWELTGEAFGATPPNQDPDGNGQPFVLNMRFPGQRYDAATGLNYNYFRDYEPGTGRYVQSDPIGLDGGISTYAYARSDPLGLFDPNGLVEFMGFNTKEEAAIRKAFDEAIRTLKNCDKCKCNADGSNNQYCSTESDRYRYIAALEDATFIE